MNAPLRHRERRPIPLNLILGRSPQNCRPDASDEDVAELAASIDALGLITPMLVSAAPGALLRFQVDAGGRRLAAYRLLVERGKLPADVAIDCVVLVADEGTVRELSLAENTIRTDLHPADECAAFEAMRVAGVPEAKIAADFGITERQVRQRLKLTKLSPLVRSAWRDGMISLDVAQVVTVAGSHDMQDAVLVAADKYDLHNASSMRRRILNITKATSFDTPQAAYVGIDAYRAAGGEIDDNLFEDHPLIFDAPLLDRLARVKMLHEGEAILAETGFGFCLIKDDVENSGWWASLDEDCIAQERTRLNEIDAEREEDIEGETDDAETDRMVRLDAEEQQIKLRAILRGNTPQVRATAGIFLDLDGDGHLIVDYGVIRPVEQPAREPSTTAKPATKPTPAPTSPAKAPDPIEAAGSGRGMIRTILEATIRQALVRILGTRPDLAMMFMVARYGATWRPAWIDQGFGLDPSHRTKPSTIPTLARIHGKDFDAAIATCTDAHLADLTTAFCAIVGGSIRMTNFAVLKDLDPMMRAFARRGAALRPAFVEAMDYDRYFEAATKAACIAALDAMEIASVDRQAKKPLLAAQAVEQARKYGWLPFPLAGWAAIEASSPEAIPVEPIAAPPADAKPLAEAMGDALDADAAAQLTLRTFLEQRVELSEGGAIKASVLYDAYRRSTTMPVPLRAFGDEVASLEIEKKRRKDGVFYLGIALKDGVFYLGTDTATP